MLDLYPDAQIIKSQIKNFIRALSASELQESPWSELQLL